MPGTSATIIDISTHTPSVKTFTLDCGLQPFAFKPGQWVDIHLDVNDESHNGGYSITSIPNDNNTIELAIKYAPNFPLTTHLHQHCNIGDKLYLSNAQGNVCLTQPITSPLVFIAGGVGISPLISMLRYAAAIKTSTPAMLLYSITHVTEYLFHDTLQTIKQSLPQFRYLITVTRDAKQSIDFNGRINRDILLKSQPPANAHYYLCGPPQMVDDVANLLTTLQTELQLDPNNIHYDKWW